MASVNATTWASGAAVSLDDPRKDFEADREHPEADGERDPELDDPEEAEEWTEVIERDSLGSKRKRLQPRKRLGFRRPGCLVGTGFDYPRFFELEFPGGARRLLIGVQRSEERRVGKEFVR